MTQLAPWLTASRWPTGQVRYVARLGTGHTPSRQHPEYWEDCTVPWVTLADVWQLRDGTVDTITETAEKVSEIGLANSAAVRHRRGTVILSRTASVGFSGILGFDMATSQDFATWTCGARLLPRYLLYVLRAMAPDLKRLATGSTHKTIYMPDIAQLRTPLPPIDDQRRIADFLDTESERLSAIIARQQRVRNLVNKREQAILDGEIDGLTAEYGAAPLRRFVIRVEQGVSPQCDDRPADDEEWGVLKVSCLRAGEFYPEENKTLPAGEVPARRYEVRAGDFLVSRANTPGLVGVAAVVPLVRTRLLVPDKIFRIDISPTIDREYLACVARSSKIRGLCAAASHGASQSMANLRIEEIKAWPVPTAPLSAQQQLADGVRSAKEHVDAMTRAIDTQLALLSERRQALITAAVTGEIDVTTVGRAAEWAATGR